MFLADGPHVEPANLANTSDAAIPLRFACVMCSLYISLGSSQTPSTLTLISLVIWWSAIRMLFARSSRAVRRLRVKWISWYFSGANFAP